MAAAAHQGLSPEQWCRFNLSPWGHSDLTRLGPERSLIPLLWLWALDVLIGQHWVPRPMAAVRIPQNTCTGGSPNGGWAPGDSPGCPSQMLAGTRSPARHASVRTAELVAITTRKQGGTLWATPREAAHPPRTSHLRDRRGRSLQLWFLAFVTSSLAGSGHVSPISVPSAVGSLPRAHLFRMGMLLLLPPCAVTEPAWLLHATGDNLQTSNSCTSSGPEILFDFPKTLTFLGV